MEKKEHIRKLLDAFASGRISRAAFDELHQYLSANDQDEVIASWVDEHLRQEEDNDQIPVNRQKMISTIINHPDFERKSRRHSGLLRYTHWLGGTAALICIGIGLWWTQPVNEPWQEAEDNNTTVSATSLPASGTDKAVLRLADGTVVDLEEASNGVVASEAGVSVVMEGSELEYRQSAHSTGTVQAEHSIHIPKGKQYRLTLPDGSRVWLNAASSIIFPVQFAEDKRVVTIEGEAFFEIHHDSKKPFVVQTALQTLEVLGTTFNVSAYADDGYVKTALISGSVRVERSGDGPLAGRSLILSPGEQSLIEADGNTIRRAAVDTRRVASWKDGLFTFHNEPIEEVMRKVARWYDVEVEYRDGMAGKRIGGSVQRFQEVNKLMKALQATGLLRYQMEGGKILIMK
ncbi:FecR family protein [Parapedobacter deserti]|uniref:FecR family protein n=1 Tax=Parapedobacter deserti TaxID=1912957 RepID=A0ABV7JT36_9SPHI